MDLEWLPSMDLEWLPSMDLEWLPSMLRFLPRTILKHFSLNLRWFYLAVLGLALSSPLKEVLY